MGFQRGCAAQAAPCTLTNNAKRCNAGSSRGLARFAVYLSSALQGCSSIPSVLSRRHKDKARFGRGLDRGAAVEERHGAILGPEREKVAEMGTARIPGLSR